MSSDFPGTGHKYLVDFRAFKVILWFASETSLTYTPLRPDGSPDEPATVVIKSENIAPDVWLVTWTESDNTTVVHIEDYGHKTIITNITTPPPNFRFDQFHGTFEDADAPPAETLTYAHDIRPLFRDTDIACMRPRGKLLDDPTWMCKPANARQVLNAVKAGRMPPDTRWPPERVALFKQWIDQGLNP
jgi:molybdenum cofactor biosynthesis MoaF-like protein